MCVCERERKKQRSGSGEINRKNKRRLVCVRSSRRSDTILKHQIQSKAPHVFFMCSLSPFRVPSYERASFSSRLLFPDPSHYK